MSRSTRVNLNFKPLAGMIVFFMLAFICAQTMASRCGDCLKNDNCPAQCKKITCCDKMGGVNYCDSSVGRFVCHNGYLSECYCTRHAVMDLQNIEGCCLWQGGVLTTDETGLVICNNGGTSEICGLSETNQSIASW